MTQKSASTEPAMENEWTKRRTVMSLTSQWIELHCEEWQKPEGEVCEYWRVKKPDSLIVIPVYDLQLLLPAPSYRPGIGRCTLDFPGGRIDHTEKSDIKTSAQHILLRELNLDESSVARITPMDATGTIVNSSFNSQKLLLARADLFCIDDIAKGVRYHSLDDTDRLLRELECLQCSYALMRFRQIYTR